MTDITTIKDIMPFILRLNIERECAHRIAENLEDHPLIDTIIDLVDNLSDEILLGTSFGGNYLNDFLNERGQMMNVENPELWFLRNVLLYFAMYINQPMYIVRYAELIRYLDFHDDIELMQQLARITSDIYIFIPYGRKLLDNPDFISKMVEANPQIIFKAQFNLLENKEIVYEAIRQEPTIYQYLSNQLKEDVDITLRAIKTNPCLYKKMPYKFGVIGNKMTPDIKRVIIASIILDDGLNERRFHQNGITYPNLYQNTIFDSPSFRLINQDYFNDPDIVRAVEARQVPEELQTLRQLIMLDYCIQGDIDIWLSIVDSPIVISTLSGEETQLYNWIQTDNILNLMTSQAPEYTGCDIYFEDDLVSKIDCFEFKNNVIKHYWENGVMPVGLIVFPEELDSVV